MTDEHRKDLARRTIILILSVCLISYLFKILGSTLFNKFITNPAFIKASNIIDTTYWLNILCYGLLGNIITLLTFCMACRKLRLKWFEYLITTKITTLIDQYRQSEMFATFFNESGNIHLDELYRAAKDAIKKSGQVEYAGIIFNETDVDKLYSYIKNTVQGG